MRASPSPNVIDFYAAGFRAGMVDLSSSSPTAGAAPGATYPPPGGSIELRQAIADRYPGLGPEDFVVTNGASEALAAAAFAFARAGEIVSVPVGAYPSFSEMASRIGAVLARDESPNREARLLLVNNPTVPGGRLLDLRQRLKVAHASGTRVVSDEVYLDLRPGSAARPAVMLSHSAVSIGDVSKPLGLGGLRIGWAVSRDPEAIAAISRCVQILSGGPSAVAMDRATAAMRDYDRLVTERHDAAAENAPRIFAALAEAGWTFEAPQAGWTFVARPPVPLGDAQALALSSAGLFMVPASAFGLADGYRLSVFAPAESLRLALTLTGLRRRSPARALVVMAKAPLPGFSKTRLARSIGEEAAADLAAAFLGDTLSLARKASDALIVAFAPATERRAFEGRAPNACWLPQPEGDLGERIATALSHALANHTRAVVIGTDTPHLHPDVIEEAFRALESSPVVIGPAQDGGFYLLGLALEPPPEELLRGVVWSTETVFERVVQNASALGLAVQVLRTLTDIDDEASLMAAEAEVLASPFAERTRAVLGGLRARMTR